MDFFKKVTAAHLGASERRFLTLGSWLSLEDLLRHSGYNRPATRNLNEKRKRPPLGGLSHAGM